MDPLQIVILISLFFFGAILGSFACCQAWRIRLKEQGKKSPGKWSVCLSCGKRLTTKENIPVFSWLAQKGKCRKCGAKIGASEILSELSLALALPLISIPLFSQFVYAINSSQILNLVVLTLTTLMLIVSITIMWILMVYDAKWQKLPTSLLTILNICAIMYVILSSIGLILNGASLQTLGISLLKTLGSAAILAGPYYLLATFSKEKLVGSGDWLVALPVALLLGHWWLAIIELFLANFLGSIFGVMQRVKNGARQIPFGPFLVIAFVAVYAGSAWLLHLIVGL